MSFSLYSHQRENLAFWRKMARGFTLLPYGSGKTVIAVRRIADLADRMRTLVVTTVGTVDKWVRALEEFGGPGWKVARLLGTRKERWRAFLKPHHVAVLNYQGMLVLGNALRRMYGLIVFDEIHNLRNPYTRISRAAPVLSLEARHVYGMTGSPVLETPMDMFGLMRAVQPRCFGVDFAPWRKRYFHRRTAEEKEAGETAAWVPNPGAARVLSATFHALSFYRRKDQLDVKYPKEIHKPPRVFALSAKARRAYLECEAELRVILKDGRSGRFAAEAKLTKLMQLARGWCFVDRKPWAIDVGPALLEVEAFLEEIRGSQAVLWAVHVPEIAMLRRLCERMGLRTGMIHGKVPVPERTRIIDRLNAGALDVAVAHPKCIGEGLDLEAHHSYRFSYTWSALQYHQSIGRFGRITTRTNTVTFTNQRAEDTGDERVLDALHRKADILDEMLAVHKLVWPSESERRKSRRERQDAAA